MFNQTYTNDPTSFSYIQFPRNSERVNERENVFGSPATIALANTVSEWTNIARMVGYNNPEMPILTANQ